MALSRQRSPNSKKAEKDYLKSNGIIKLVDLAKKYNVSPGTVRSWKSRYKWDDKINKSVATIEKAKKKQMQRCEKEKKKKVEKIEQKMIEIIEDADLTEKQRLFCLYYSKNPNAAQAVIKAGYDVNNSQRAAEIGYQLLHSTPVKKEIERLKELKYQSIMIGEDDLVEMHMRIAFSDITDFVEFGQEEVPIVSKEGDVTFVMGNVVNFKDSNMVDGQLIKEIKKGRQGISIKLEDKQKSLDFLERYFLVNPMSKHKIAYDNARLQMNKEDLEHKKKMDEMKNW